MSSAPLKTTHYIELTKNVLDKLGNTDEITKVRRCKKKHFKNAAWFWKYFGLFEESIFNISPRYSGP